MWESEVKENLLWWTDVGQSQHVYPMLPNRRWNVVELCRYTYDMVFEYFGTDYIRNRRGAEFGQEAVNLGLVGNTHKLNEKQFAKTILNVMATCRTSSSSMRSVQLMRSTLVSEPLYSMTVPLKVISLLNMATTKFPFSKKLDWLSDNAGEKKQNKKNQKQWCIWAGKYGNSALLPAHCCAKPHLQHVETVIDCMYFVLKLGDTQWWLRQKKKIQKMRAHGSPL